MYIRKNYIFGAVVSLCAVISITDFLHDGNVAILRALKAQRSLTTTTLLYTKTTSSESTSSPSVIRDCIECDCSNVTLDSSDIKRLGTPYVAPGPSKIQELVPMDVLKKKLQMNSIKGLKYLDHVSLSRYYQCRPSNSLPIPEDGEKRCKNGTFVDKNHPLVALVSFHGSGNTWIRHLLEQATGIFTGSIYCDTTLKIEFPGELVVSGNVVAIKTHRSDSRELPRDVQIATGKEAYDKAIMIVRDPFDALVSEANRRWNAKHSMNSHVGLADETAFISNSKWDWFVEYKGIVWGFQLHTWLAQDFIPVHIVQYESLVNDTHGELKKILDFLDVQVSREAIECAVQNSGGRFKRTHHLNFNPFSTENCDAINRYISQATPLLARHGIKYKQRH